MESRQQEDAGPVCDAEGMGQSAGEVSHCPPGSALRPDTGRSRISAATALITAVSPGHKFSSGTVPGVSAGRPLYVYLLPGSVGPSISRALRKSTALQTGLDAMASWKTALTLVCREDHMQGRVGWRHLFSLLYMELLST